MYVGERTATVEVHAETANQLWECESIKGPMEVLMYMKHPPR